TGDAGPRLPVWLRVLLPTILFLPAASAGLVLILIPGYEGLLARDDEVAVLAYAPFAAVVLAAYVLVSWALLRWVDRRPFRALGLRVDARAVLALIIGYAIAQAAALLTAVAADSFGMGRQIDPAAMDQPTISPVAVLAVVLRRAFVLPGCGGRPSCCRASARRCCSAAICCSPCAAAPCSAWRSALSPSPSRTWPERWPAERPRASPLPRDPLRLRDQCQVPGHRDAVGVG